MKERLSLQMEHPGDRLDFSEDFELFSLKKIKSANALKKLVRSMHRGRGGVKSTRA